MTLSPFSEIPLAPADPILGLTEAFQSDKNPKKVNLGVGVYTDGSGKVPVLNVVREAERRWFEKEDSKSYLPIDGAPVYAKEVRRLLFGDDSPLVAEGRVVTAQALGGTGGLKLGADFLHRFFPESAIWISTPSWENHRAVFDSAGLVVNEYPYYDAKTQGVDFAGMLKTLSSLPARSVVLLHACCHNPTGVDLDAQQWNAVADTVKQRGLLPFIDFAYQGFGAGLVEDAVAVKIFSEKDVPMLLASSFSKSFSLYRERVGAISLVTASAEESKRVTSQLKRVIRTNYSNPSSHGAQVVGIILSDPELRARWEGELKEMRERIQSMRAAFVDQLAKKGVARDFSFIRQQRGMFSYSGIDVERVRRLRSEFGLYIVDSGRICVAALNDKNMDYVTDSIAAVFR
jgi:aromatic-amino-acid transaminase